MKDILNQLEDIQIFIKILLFQIGYFINIYLKTKYDISVKNLNIHLNKNPDRESIKI
jgi:hypothetical protein